MCELFLNLAKLVGDCVVRQVSEIEEKTANYVWDDFRVWGFELSLHGVNQDFISGVK